MLVLALGLGVFADALLRVTPWGLNLLVVVLAVLAGAWLLTRWGGLELNGDGRWLALPMVGFAVCLVWRDSPTLNVANSVGLVVTASLAVLSARAGLLRLAGVAECGLGAARVGLLTAAGLLPVVLWEVHIQDLGRRRWLGPTVAAGRGVLLAIPPLLVFGSLFMAADAGFERLVRETLAIDVNDLLLHVGLAVVYAWVLGGALREMLLAPVRPRPGVASGAGPRAGVVEVAVALGLLNLLFATFVALQLPYLFGGLARVAELGYSAYARRGFFELVWVAGLSLPLVLFAHWLVREARPGGVRLVRLLALVLIGLLYLIMASAVQRMWLYVADLGLTELRVQASAWMAWLAIVLAWLVASVLRGQGQRFALGALVSAYLVVGVLDVINPDALIVQTNARYGHLESTDEGFGFDARPFASFSSDALPSITEALPTLSPAGRRQASARLARRSRPLVESLRDWRSFNVSRAQAARALGIP